MTLNPQTRPVLAVVGVGPGIGESVSRHFAAKGFSVALIARTESKLVTIQDSIRAAHGVHSAKYYVADVRDESSIIATFAAIKSELGKVNVLVYNAGSRRIRGRNLVETPSAEFEDFLKINMLGAYYASKAVIPDMLEAGKGTILFTGATASIRGSPALGGFSPGKFGLRALAQIVAREFQASGIHAVHVLVDGPVESDIIGSVVRKRWEEEGETGKLQEKDRYLMQPDDLAKVYWYLHEQPRSTWTQELDVRAQMETMFSKL